MTSSPCSGGHLAVCTMPQRTTVACSLQPNTRRSKTKPINPIMAREASITSALRNSLASKITHPRPQSEAASISAPTTAIHARRKAWRSPAMMKGEAPGMITFQNKASHCARRAQPQRIDGAHARPGVQQQRKRRRIEHDENRHHVAEAEPQDEDRHPSERGYGHQRAGERKKEAFDRPNAAHQDPERQRHRYRQCEPEQNAIEGIERVLEQGAVEQLRCEW